MAFENTDPGDIIEVQFETTNIGELSGNQDILLTLENGNKVTIDQVDGLELNVDESGTGTLTWEIQSDQTGTIYNLCVESNDSSDCIYDPLGEYVVTNITGLGPLWSFTNGGGVGADSSGVYTGFNSTFYRLSIDDGSQIWSSGQMGFQPEKAGVAVGDYQVAVQDTDGNLRLFDKSDGANLWSNSLGNSFFGSVTITPDAVVVGYRDNNSNGRVAAYSTDDGSLLWNNGVGDIPVVQYAENAGALVVASYESNTVYRYDMSDGSVIWASGGFGDRPTGADTDGDVVYFSGFDEISAWDADGNKLWGNSSYSGGALGYGAGAVYHNNAILNASDGSFIASGIGGGESGAAHQNYWFSYDSYSAPIDAYQTTF